MTYLTKGLVLVLLSTLILCACYHAPAHAGEIDAVNTLESPVFIALKQPEPDPDPEVPYVVGMTVAEAKQALGQTPFAWSITGPEDADAVVIAQNPEEGRLPANSVIALATKTPDPPKPGPDPSPDPPAPKPTPVNNGGGNTKPITPKTMDANYSIFSIAILISVVIACVGAAKTRNEKKGA